MKFKIISLKIRKNSWILGNFEIRKFEFSICAPYRKLNWNVTLTVISLFNTNS